VVFSGRGELLLTQGEKESLTVTADDNLLYSIKSEVRGGTLFIEIGEKIASSQPIRIQLRLRQIVGLDLAGVIIAEAENISTETLEINLSGISNLTMGILNAETLTISQSGTTELTITGEGVVNQQMITLSGSNTYNAPKLQSQKVDVSMSGSNNMIVWVTDFLNVDVTGVGDLDYYGNPKITQVGSGNSVIRNLGDP
jgi:hypothetical protein